MIINHRRTGEGAPLVLVHGIGHRWQAWEPVLDDLATHHDVIALDLPGFGDSPVPAGGMPRDMPAVVDAMITAFAQFGLDRPHVAGYSLGGAISLELAAAGAVASATAFSPAGFFTPAERRRALSILSTMRVNTFAPTPLVKLTLRRRSLRHMSFAPLVAYPERLDADRAIADALALRRGRGFRTVAKAAKGYAFDGARVDGSVPVTVGWGDRDRIFGVHMADRARAALPTAHVVTLPGCGHVPMSDDPATVSTLILQTTGSLSARS
ncbi:MAG: alpha/beta fold hydrolase [Hamadaea sp.]|nr:alpha/beta fold hydrolase [Hamadaea sp.]